MLCISSIVKFADGMKLIGKVDNDVSREITATNVIFVDT